MKNLRIVSVKAQDSTNLVATFTDQLATDLDISNITIESQTPNVPDPQIKSIKVVGATLELLTQPLTPLASYIITFKSGTVRFRDLNATSFLIEDGRTNVVLFLGPEESANPIFQNLKNYFLGNIYNLDDGTVVNDLLKILSSYIAKALYDIRQVKNENYLAKTVVDEPHVRGNGPFDRLNEEGAYEVLRVGKTKTGFSAESQISIDSVPSYLISLRQQNITGESLAVSSVDAEGKFNLNSFLLTVKQPNVIRLSKVTFYYTGVLPNNQSSYSYDIEKYGYQIQDERYDKDYGFRYLTLTNQQFRLSDKILNDSDFSLQNISYVSVDYSYKNLGRTIDPSTVAVTKIVPVAREVLPPITNILNLQHAPILDSNGVVARLGAVQFMDPNSNPSLSKVHPAFATELPFTYENLPSQIGEYSVDYASGTVYVFGETAANQGTGAYPALASYQYLYTYEPLIDYVYDADQADLVAMPGRELIDNSVNVSFSFQDVMIPGVDYKAEIHKEVLSERVENRIYPSINGLKVKNTPITNVFRVFNETQSQVYDVTRWSDDTVYFTFPSEPNIQTLTGERCTFASVLNELLFVEQELTTAGNVKVFQVTLQNRNIISSTEDCIGSSFNTSIVLSNSNVFAQEIYFDDLLSVQTNVNRLTVGKYTVDYLNGIVYVAVSGSQGYDLGTISYKSPYVVPTNPHIITPVDLYFRRNLLQPKDKTFAYRSYEEASVLPAAFEQSNERYLNGDVNSIYFLNNGSVGAYLNGNFTPGVSNNIKNARSVFEYNDVLNNRNPVNFSDVTAINDKLMDVSSKVVSSVQVVQKSGSNYFVNSGVDLSYLSPNIGMQIMVRRLSDSTVMWNGSGTYTLGTPMMLRLPGIGVPVDGDTVQVTVTFTIQTGSRMVVDYNRGEYYLDYTYLADEIILSYEYGENQLDFREANSISENDQYYVTYRVGALRDALLKNFGTLVDIPLFTVFDNNFERERYREALIAALSSFVEGPTIDSMSRIISTITHVKPEINESIFENWSLGSSYLYPEGVKVAGKPLINKGKFGNGLLLKDKGQAIQLPVSSNLRLEEGTYSNWITPQWNGLDNDATLTFTVNTSSGHNPIFIGAGRHTPEIHQTTQGSITFSVSKSDVKSPFGRPNKTIDGVYIYLDKDGVGTLTGPGLDGYYGDGYDGYRNAVQPTGNSFYRWYVDVVTENTASGISVPGFTPGAKITVSTDGEFFDSKLLYRKNNGDTITSGTDKLSFTTSYSQQGFSFLADRSHYLFDLGEKDRNRISLFKDPAGYLNFRVIDKHKHQYRLSADVSNWRANQNHHVAVSWTLNSKSERDEMHLFVDGTEVPNIIRYGQGFPLGYGQKFRTVNPEEIVSMVTRPVVAGDTMSTTAGSNVVTAVINFTASGILPGDNIIIDEPGFNPNGYTVSTVGTNSLTLASPMPQSLSGDAHFIVNKTNITVKSRVDLAPKTAVYLIHPIYSAADGVTTGTTLTSASTNFTALGIQVGNLLRVETSPDLHYVVVAVAGNTLTLNQTMNVTGTHTFYLYKNTEVELPGVNSLVPFYNLTQDANHNNLVVLRSGAQKGDLVRIKTFGLNFRQTNQTYYSWRTDNGIGSNVMQTRLPAPVSLDDVKIRKVLVQTTTISSQNGTYGSGVWTHNNSNYSQPILSDTGRTLEVTISGANIDFSTATSVTISGNTNTGVGSEVLNFSAAGKKTTAKRFLTITSIVVVSKPTTANQPCCTFGIKEANSIFTAETSSTVAKIQFSYQVKWGNTLSGSGQTFTDPNGFFASVDVGNYIRIYTTAAAGIYKILTISQDHKTVTVAASGNTNTSIPTFSNATYDVLNATTARSGLQNGIFSFENGFIPGTVYPISQGLYEINYATYLSAKFDPLMGQMMIGSDVELKNQANVVMDEVVIESVMKTDTRVGETVGTEGSLTSDYNALKPHTPKKTTLTLLHLENGDIVNEAPFYVGNSQAFLQSGRSVNENFSNSVVIKDKGITVDNLGILNTKTEGSIEFWVSPLLDTYNDPNYRFYFDASGNVSEKVVSTNRSTVVVSGNVGQVVSVQLQHADTGKNYFGVGTIAADRKTLLLQQELPYQNTPVVVNYVPTGLRGDRVSIYKDPYGYLNFNLRANQTDYQVRCPIFWTKDTWHRVKVTYKVNGGKKQDQVHLFVDGFERGNVLFGSGLLFGQNLIYGQSFIGQSNIITTISFQDPINELKIGSDYAGQHPAGCLIDNLRISDVSRPAYMVFGEPLDVNYNSNISSTYPVTKDLFTTYLLDFDQMKVLTDDFALLKNKNSGIFDFSLEIFDLFDIVKDSQRVKEVLETLIKTLKPANSRVSINYK